MPFDSRCLKLELNLYASESPMLSGCWDLIVVRIFKLGLLFAEDSVEGRNGGSASDVVSSHTRESKQKSMGYHDVTDCFVHVQSRILYLDEPTSGVS